MLSHRLATPRGLSSVWPKLATVETWRAQQLPSYTDGRVVVGSLRENLDCNLSPSCMESSRDYGLPFPITQAMSYLVPHLLSSIPSISLNY